LGRTPPCTMGRQHCTQLIQIQALRSPLPASVGSPNRVKLDSWPWEQT
jgi:hypothetical protein